MNGTSTALAEFPEIDAGRISARMSRGVGDVNDRKLLMLMAREVVVLLGCWGGLSY